jgi:hypothetical protein
VACAFVSQRQRYKISQPFSISRPSKIYPNFCLLERIPSGNPGTDVMLFKNIFAEKFNNKIGVFDSKQN